MKGFHFNSMLRLFFICAAIFSMTNIGHGQRMIDSLKNELKNTHHDSVKAQIHFDISGQYYLYHEDSLDQGIYHAHQTVKLGHQLNDLTWVGTAYNQLGKTYNLTESLDSATHFFEKGMNTYLELGDSLRWTMLYDNSANVMVDQGKFDEALGIKQKCLEYFKIHSDSNTIAASIFGLAWIYMEAGQGEKAIPYFRQSIQYAPHWDLLQSEVYGNMAGIYRDIGKIDSALFCFRKTAELGKTVPSIYTLNMSEYARLKMQLGEVDSAKYFLEEVLRQPGQDKKSESYNVYRILYANALSSLGENKKAQQYFNQGVGALDTSTNVKNLQLLYSTGQKINAASGDYKKAFSYIKMDRALGDSIQSAEMQNSFKEIETKYETEKKTQQIERLSLEDELKASQLASQRNWIIGLVVGLGILLFLLQRIFSQNKKISIQKEALSKALKDKNMLLKEIHHRVKNNLQVVSSLLNLQSRYVEDKSAKSAIQTGKARVQSMSLLHQNIYRNDDLKTVNIQEYFKELGDNLVDNYQLDDIELTFTTDIDDIDMDIDAVVPLGLITNELISNALKHAFQGREAGQISLSIKEKADGIRMQLSDDGVGIPYTTLPEESSSLGVQLIRNFADKLDAEVSISNVGGTTFSLHFDPKKFSAAA